MAQGSATDLVDHVLASSADGIYARGLGQASPPELRIVGALEAGVIFTPVKPVARE